MIEMIKTKPLVFSLGMEKTNIQPWNTHHQKQLKSLFRLENCNYPIATVTTVRRTGVIESLVNFNRIVSTLVFIFQLKGEESQMNIFPGWSLNNPIAVFLIFVVMVSVLGVRVKMLDTSRCLKMATANYGKENKESDNSFKINFEKFQWILPVAWVAWKPRRWTEESDLNTM